MPPVHRSIISENRSSRESTKTEVGSIPESNSKTNGLPSCKNADYQKAYECLGIGFCSVKGSEGIAEECPFCGREKLYVNLETGQHDCKQCSTTGNLYTYLRWKHESLFSSTSAEDFVRLKKKRGIASQTLKSHELAYDPDAERWLIPFKNKQGAIVTCQFYYPEKDKPNKYNLPGQPMGSYNFHRLPLNKDIPVFICEGPFDAIALDYKIGASNRAKYAILATPGAVFKPEWVEHFRGFKIRIIADNDDAGRKQVERVGKLLGESGVAREVLALKWPVEFPEEYDLNDLVRDPAYATVGVVGFIVDNSYKFQPTPKLDWSHGWEKKPEGPERIDWVWPNRLRCGSYISYSGKGGTLKSTLMREVVAKYTRGDVLPGCDAVGLPAGHVIYITAEDGIQTAWTHFELKMANLEHISILPAILKDGDPMNILDHLDELRQRIRQQGTRFVVIDGQNSVVGAPNISTDMLARHNITNKLHQFAQKENICLVGIRNEDQEGRAYGPASMGDLARGILRTEEVTSATARNQNERYFKLIFHKVSDAPPQPPIPYSVKNLGGSSREILWEKADPQPAQVDMLITSIKNKEKKT